MFEYSSVSASSYDPGALVAKLNDSTAEGWEVVAIVPTGGDVSAFLRREAPAPETDAAAETSTEPEAPAAEVPVAEGWAADVAEEPAGEDTGEYSREEAAAGVGAAHAADTWAASDPAASTDTAVGETMSVETAAEETAEQAAAVEEPAGWAAAPIVPEEPAAEEPAASTEAQPESPAEPAIDEVLITETTVAEPTAEPTPEPAPEPVPEPAPVVTTPAGWYPDPSGRFELRYWDGTQWTEHVARSGQQFTDPPVR